MKQSYEMGMTNLRELAELSAASNRKAVDVLSARFYEGLQEFAQQVKACMIFSLPDPRNDPWDASLWISALDLNPSELSPSTM